MRGRVWGAMYEARQRPPRPRVPKFRLTDAPVGSRSPLRHHPLALLCPAAQREASPDRHCGGGRGGRGGGGWLGRRCACAGIAMRFSLYVGVPKVLGGVGSGRRRETGRSVLTRAHDVGDWRGWGDRHGRMGATALQMHWLLRCWACAWWGELSAPETSASGGLVTA